MSLSPSGVAYGKDFDSLGFSGTSMVLSSVGSSQHQYMYITLCIYNNLLWGSCVTSGLGLDDYDPKLGELLAN